MKTYVVGVGEKVSVDERELFAEADKISDPWQRKIARVSAARARGGVKLVAAMALRRKLASTLITDEERQLACEMRDVEKQRRKESGVARSQRRQRRLEAVRSQGGSQLVVGMVLRGELPKKGITEEEQRLVDSAQAATSAERRAVVEKARLAAAEEARTYMEARQGAEDAWEPIDNTGTDFESPVAEGVLYVQWNEGTKNIAPSWRWYVTLWEGDEFADKSGSEPTIEEAIEVAKDSLVGDDDEDADILSK